MKIEDVITAVRRAQRAWCEQVSTGEPLDFGVAFSSDRFPAVPDANQLRDAWLADADPAKAYDRVEAWYAERGRTCFQWTPASGQLVEPIEQLLVPRGWRRRDTLAMGLIHGDAVDAPPGSVGVRVLPARAMRRAYRSLLSETHDANAEAIDAGLERLDDSSFDGFVAQVDGEAAGRVAYHELGDAGAMVDLAVSADYRDRGVEAALVAHFLQMARRLSPRVIVTLCDAADLELRARLEGYGFAVAGTLPRFVRNLD